MWLYAFGQKDCSKGIMPADGKAFAEKYSVRKITSKIKNIEIRMVGKLNIIPIVFKEMSSLPVFRENTKNIFTW